MIKMPQQYCLNHMLFSNVYIQAKFVVSCSLARQYAVKKSGALILFENFMWNLTQIKNEPFYQ